MDVTVTLHLEKVRGAWVSRDDVTRLLLLELSRIQPIRVNDTSYAVAGVEAHLSEREEADSARDLGPVLLLMEKSYLAGVFDDDIETCALVERLLTKGAGIMEFEKKRRVQVTKTYKAHHADHIAAGTVDHRKTGRPRKERRITPEEELRQEDEYGAYLLALVGEKKE